MKNFKIFFSLLCVCIFSKNAFAQPKSEIQTTGIYFKGSMSFAAIKTYDAKNPVPKKIFKAAPTETDIKETTDEINKRLAGFPNEISVISDPIVRRNNLQPKGASRSAAVNSCVGFEALPTNYGGNPPDVHGAVGFDHLVTTLNTEVRIQNKYSNIISTVTPESFFTSTGETDIFDPRIMYDQSCNRFFFMACCSRRNASSGFVIAASQTPDPTGIWNFYKIDADPADTLWFDYGNMGFSSDKICISGNMFNNVAGLNGDGGRMFTLNKSELTTGVALSSVIRTRGVAANTCPVLSFDNTSTCYAVAVQSSTSAKLVLYSVTGTPALATVNTLGTVDYGSANGWAANPPGTGNILPQSGSAITIHAGDDRMQSAILRNGRIFWTNSFFLPAAAPTYGGIQYGSFTASTRATLNFAGIWNSTGDEMFSRPNMAVNADEDVAVAFAYFSTTAFPSAAVAYGTSTLYLAYDITKAGEDSYTTGYDPSGRLRWGDYMSASVDPTDDKSMWTLSQYAKIPNNNTWSTWWAKICTASCTPSYVLNGVFFPNAVKKFEAANTISSAATIYSGAYIKYDAGLLITLSPGFRAEAGSNYRAFIEGCGGNQ